MVLLSKKFEIHVDGNGVDIRIDLWNQRLFSLLKAGSFLLLSGSFVTSTLQNIFQLHLDVFEIDFVTLDFLLKVCLTFNSVHDVARLSWFLDFNLLLLLFLKRD